MEYWRHDPGVQARRVDIVSSGGLNIRPDRLRAGDFLEPNHFASGTAFLTARIRSLRRRAGRTWWTTASASPFLPGRTITRENGIRKRASPRAHHSRFPDGQSAVKLLQDGRVDIVVLSDATILELQKESCRDAEPRRRAARCPTTRSRAAPGPPSIKDDTAPPRCVQRRPRQDYRRRGPSPRS